MFLTFFFQFMFDFEQVTVLSVPPALSDDIFLNTSVAGIICHLRVSATRLQTKTEVATEIGIRTLNNYLLKSPRVLWVRI